MRVTLIYVGIGVAGFNPDRPIGDREGSWIGHGIASIGAAAKYALFDVDLIDLRQLGGWDELGKVIRENPSDVYGLSVSAVDYYSALKTVFEIKTHAPAARIIVGGIHPSIFPDQYDYAVIDTVVMGEGEVTFVDLLRRVERGDYLPRKVQGVKPNLDYIPWVDRELFDYQRELNCFFAPDQCTPSVTMIAGRGCPYKCAYCQPAENAVFGKPHRMRGVENVIGELQHLRDRYRYNSITFWDDTFTFNRQWVMDFCDMYERSGITATIAANSRADIICNNESMIERMADVGVDWLVVGLESGSQRILDLIQKGTTVEQNVKAVEICRKYGIKVFGTIMYGLPTETNDEIMATVHMIERIQPAMASPFWFTPIPGTRLYDYCADNNLILDGVEGRTIARTGVFLPTIKGVDYDFLLNLTQKQLG
jgi:anaerobic magnesium-protoporphyrin IX monomethyl ester cyclase